MAGVRKKPQPNRKFQGWFIDYHGERKFFTGTHSKSETQRMAERLEDEHRQVKLGYRPAPKSADKHRGRPFEEVATEYISWGTAQGGRSGRPWGVQHAKKRWVMLDWWKAKLNLTTLSDLDGILPRVEEALRELQSEELPARRNTNRPANRAGKTIQNRAEALKALCGWCVTRGYLNDDPLRSLIPFDATPRTIRRALTPNEIMRLIAVAPEHRKLLYQVALSTGLRAGELRALQVDDIDIERGCLHLDPAWTKNRRGGFQPLPRDLVNRLAAFAESGQAKELYRRHYTRSDSTTTVPENPLLFVPTHAARQIEEDMKAASIPKEGPGGLIDFHSLRTTYVTLVLEAGANAKEAMALARHVTANLTMNIYGRARDERLAELTEKVGQIALAEENRATCVQKVAAGAEGMSPNSFDSNVLHPWNPAEGQGFKSPILHQPTKDR